MPAERPGEKPTPLKIGDRVHKGERLGMGVALVAMLVLVGLGAWGGYTPDSPTKTAEDITKKAKDIQDKICDHTGLSVTLVHYPTGCSKWNPVEYRLFSQISMNWAGRPLRTLQMMLGYIRGTTTSTGLRVQALTDERMYEKGRKITAREMEQLNLRPHEVCPTWNYTLSPSH